MSYVIFDTNTTFVLSFDLGIHSPEIAARPDVLLNPSTTLVVGLPVRYWKVSGGALVPTTVGERVTIDTTLALEETTSMRTGGVLRLSNKDDLGILLRAFADITKDEINIIRSWIRDFKTQAAAATSLANLQTRIASLPNLNDRTLGQLRTAIESRIEDGSVDN